MSSSRNVTEPNGPERADTTGLYRILQIPKNATEEEIKRAYRRLALQYHPDKNPGATEQFKEIKHAYEILSDPRKRSVYDRYGEFGLSLLDTPMAVLVDPEHTKSLCRFAMYSTAFTVLLAMFFSFLAKKVDASPSDKQWSWAVVFIPVWLIDFLVVYTVIPQAFTVQQDRSDHDNSGSHDTTTAARRRGIFASIYLGLVVIFQVFVVLREDKVLNPPSDGSSKFLWSAAAIFLPYWILEAVNWIHCLITFLYLRAQLLEQYEHAVQAQEPGTPPPPKPGFLVWILFFLEAHWWWLIRVSFCILLVLKLDGKINWHWALIFLPFYIAAARYLLVILWSMRKLKSVEHSETRAQTKSMLTFMAVVFTICSILFFSLIGMLVSKLQNADSIRLSIVLIPIWILLGLLSCCCGCCLPCLLCMQGVALDEVQQSGDLENHQGAGTSELQMMSSNQRWRMERGLYLVVSPQRRLTRNGGEQSGGN